MTSTRGRKKRPLPYSAEQGLSGLGFTHPFGGDAGKPYHLWTHPQMPGVGVRVVASNIPGSTDVTWEWNGRAPLHGSVDDFIAQLTLLKIERTGKA